MSWTSSLTAFWLGFVYFVAAIPSGVALGLHAGIAALLASIGYSAGAAVVLLAGEPLRRWWQKRRAAKAGLPRSSEVPTPQGRGPLWRRAWGFGGVWCLGLAAPMTLGPQVGALLAVSLGEKPWRVWLAFTLGIIPWAVAFAFATQLGAGWLNTR